MENPGAIIFLVLFLVATLLEYLSVRRRWLSSMATAIVGGIATTVFFILYSLSRGNVIEQALVVGPVIGIIFTALTVGAAAFFRANEGGSRQYVRSSAAPESDNTDSQG